MDLRKLVAHFKTYHIKKGSAEIPEVQPDVKKIPMVRKAAEEEAKPAPKAPVKLPPKVEGKPEAKDKPTEQISVVEKVDDLDAFVKKIIDREVETTIKRVIEEVVRKELGKDLTQLEQGIRPEVQTEVVDQARNVEQEIKKVAPGGPATPTKEEKPVVPPPPPPKGAGAKLTWTRSAVLAVIQILDNVFIRACADDATKGEVLFSDETGYTAFTDFTVAMRPDLSVDQQRETYLEEIHSKLK